MYVLYLNDDYCGTYVSIVVMSMYVLYLCDGVDNYDDNLFNHGILL